MADQSVTHSEPRTEEEYRRAVEALVAEMESLHQQRLAAQNDMDAVRHEARTIQTQTARIKARTASRLDALDELVPF
jgi:predicted  nucleic acid-binding Zn-ribbon protein